jgi:hypothetical protein
MKLALSPDGKAFGWSPDGKWLAVAQDFGSVLTPDQPSALARHAGLF